MRLRSLLLTAAPALVLAAGGATLAQAAGPPGHGPDRSALADAFTRVDRTTAWTEVSRVKLDFPTFHTEGIAFTDDRIFLSAVEILEPTVKYPEPVDGYDRTPGRGVGHLFVLDRDGNLQRDLVLGEGDRYHPGGIDVDGENVWVPVAEYRPDSATLMYSVDVDTLKVTRRFQTRDHFGGVVFDRVTKTLYANTWGSRRFAEFSRRGRVLDRWVNPTHFIDYQDCQYVAVRQQLCGGVTNLPQTPTAGGSTATYELGGLALIDSRTHDVVHEVPFQRWSTAGHVATRNPTKLSLSGRTLTLRVAPDNGDEGNGTEIITYEATVG